MSNPTYETANETFGQARQGSVAAIIQVLNEQLSASGIRTRAVVADGMLQILCEAAKPQQLEKQTVVSRVRQILENISPQRISKVNINSRIVKEEQLLWLEEINRDPENALLWSEVITLKRPFFVKRWIRDRNLKPAGPILKDISQPDPNQSQLSSKLMGSVGLAALLLGTLWIFREDLNQVEQNDAVNNIATENIQPSPNELPPLPQSESTDEQPGDRTADTTPPTPPTASETAPQTAATAEEQPPSATPQAAASAPSSASADSAETAGAETIDTETAGAETNGAETNGAGPNNSGQTADAFAEAVRIANLASTDGQNAQTAAEWLDLAARWQRASDLMAQIPNSSEQYAQAAERVKTYADNSQAALAQAAAAQ